MPLGVSEATLVAVLLEAILFGAFTVLYAVTLYTIVPKLGIRLNQVVLAVATGMYALALSHLAIDIQRLVTAFVVVSKTTHSDAFLRKISEPLFVAQLSVYCAQTILGDAFMIYRLYIVWAKNKLVTAFPAMCFIANISMGIGGPLAVSRAYETDLIYVGKVKCWGTAFYAITLATNFTSTLLIALRIWWIGRRTASLGFKSRDLSPILIIVIESGAVYSATLIAVIVTYTINDWSHTLFLDAICPIVGLVFTSIIVRIGLGVSTDASSSGLRGLSNHIVTPPVRPITVDMTRTRIVLHDVGESVRFPRSGSFSDAFGARDVKEREKQITAYA